jgi:hypothetical protein
MSTMAGVGVLLAACGDDDSPASTPVPTGPTPTPVPTQTANQEAIAAAEAYLNEEGVDGNTGDFTDPLNCSSITSDSTGDFCVHDSFSTYAPGLVILVIGDEDDPENETWEIRLSPSEAGWEVTGAERFGTSE